MTLRSPRASGSPPEWRPGAQKFGQRDHLP
nr:MAG TPA: hypothetical protein [Caudoviricetes sp.]